ncbi:unnamed protein product, partial [Brenthis ino]
MQDCKGISTPMEVGLNVDEKEEILTNIPYRELVRSLMYLATISRPDIAYATGFLSRYMHCPTATLWKAGKRILRYLKQTKEKGLVCKKEDSNYLQAFSDADWAGNRVDRKSEKKEKKLKEIKEKENRMRLREEKMLVKVSQRKRKKTVNKQQKIGGPSVKTVSATRWQQSDDLLQLVHCSDICGPFNNVSIGQFESSEVHLDSVGGISDDTVLKMMMMEYKSIRHSSYAVLYYSDYNVCACARLAR